MRIHFLRSFFDGKSMYIINDAGVGLCHDSQWGNIRFVK